MSASPGDTASRSSRTHPRKVLRIFNASTKKPPYGKEWKPNLPITFSNCCPWRGHHVTSLFFLPNTRAYGLPPHWSSISAREPRIFLADHGTSDRKSTRLNSSHQIISYAVFCLKKKKN